MLKEYDFVVVQLRQVHSAAVLISTFKPLGKDAAAIALMIPAVPDPLRVAYMNADTALAAARGVRDESLKPVHDWSVDFLAQARGQYSGSETVQRQLDIILTKDKTPQEQLTRGGQTIACWQTLPDIGGSPFTIGHDDDDIDQDTFQAALDTATNAQHDVDTKRMLMEKQQGDVNKKVKEFRKFNTAALEYGRSRYSEGTPEREIIDAIVTLQPTIAPGQATLDVVSGSPTEATLTYDAPHATSFDIYRKNPGETDFTLVESDRIEKTITFSDITAGVTTFKVVGRNSEGTGPESEEKTVGS
jgi:hypothetical protein